MSRKTVFTLIGAMLIALAFTSGAQAAVWYVNQSSVIYSGVPGSSWWKGFHTVQEGVTAAAAGDQVWVKKGTYLENIVLKDGVALYGGFAGSENLLSQRNWTLNPTILDGGGVASVVTILSCPNPATRVDGFVIRNGQGSGYSSVGSPVCGGGIYGEYSSPVIANNTIENNIATHGAGIHFYGVGSPIVSDNIIRNNLCTLNSGNQSFGAGIGTYTITGLTFTGNTVTGNGNVGGVSGGYGAAVAIWGREGGGVARVTVARNRIVGNTGDGGLWLQWVPALVADNLIAGNRGSGIADCGAYVAAEDQTIVNNTIVSNSEQGIVLNYTGQNDFIANNIVASNLVGIQRVIGTLVLSRNDVFGNGTDYVGVDDYSADLVSADPLFANVGSGNYHLQHSPLSPCIDAGDNAYAAGTGDKDLDGKTRVYDGMVDIGCYESGSVPPFTTCSLAGTLGLNGWYISAPILATLSALDAGGTGVASTKWAYVGTSTFWTVYSAPISYFRTGISGLRYFSTDLDGNVETVRTTAIKLDNTLPALGISSPVGTTPYSKATPVDFAGTASDYLSGLLSVRYKNAAAGSGLCAGTTSWSASVPLVQGANRVVIWAKDNAGNSKTAGKTITFDNIAPTVVSTTPVKNATGVARKPTVRVRFGENVKAAGFDVLKAFYDPSKTGTSKYWRATVPVYSGNIMSFGPLSTMSANKRITVNLNAGAAQVYAGNLSAAAYTWGFKTGSR